jgi:phage shock protein A
MATVDQVRQLLEEALAPVKASLVTIENRLDGMENRMGGLENRVRGTESQMEVAGARHKNSLIGREDQIIP